MATCVVLQDPPPPPPPPRPKTYVLQLDEAEAAAVHALVGCITGSPIGPRDITSRIFVALTGAGLHTYLSRERSKDQECFVVRHPDSGDERMRSDNITLRSVKGDIR